MKNKFNFKKILSIISLCLICLCAIFPFTNFNDIDTVNAMSLTNYDFGLSSDVNLNSWETTSFVLDDGTVLTDYANIWTDGVKLYYSNNDLQYIFNNSGGVFVSHTWNGDLYPLYGKYVWGYNGQVYYSYGSVQYYFDKSLCKWNSKTWYKSTGSSLNINGSYVTNCNGVLVYCEQQVSNVQYHFDVANDCWVSYGKWNAPVSSTLVTLPNPSCFFSTTNNLYYLIKGNLYLADMSTFTMTSVDFNCVDDDVIVTGANVWFNGVDLFYSSGSRHYVFDELTYSWLPADFYGDISFSGYTVFCYGGKFYGYDSSSSQYYSNLFGYYYYGYSEGYKAGYDLGYAAGFEAGVASVDSDDSSAIYQEGYQNGYDAGVSTNSGYVSGYDAGYNIGYKAGTDYGNSLGYSSGYDAGQNVGYQNGYNKGINDSDSYTFYNLFGSVLDAPVNVFTSLFNFELLGVNLLGLITGLFTLSFIILLLKLCLGGK